MNSWQMVLKMYHEFLGELEDRTSAQFCKKKNNFIV